METAGLIAFQLVVMLLLILFGWFLFKRGFLTDEGNRQLSGVMLTFVLPVVVFMAFQTDYTDRMLHNILLAGVVAFVGHALPFAYSVLLLRRGQDTALERFSVVYSNCAFIGIPLVSAVYGGEGVLYLSMSILMYNLFMWTHGTLTMSGSFRGRDVLRALRAPGFVAAVLGFACFLLRWRLPELLARPLGYIYDLNTPLAMIITGATMAQTQLKTALKKPGLYRVAAIKLLLIPVSVLLIFAFVPAIPTEVLATGVIAVGCPTATATIMMAHRHQRNAPYAAELVVLITLMSMVTLPLIVFLTSAVRA